MRWICAACWLVLLSSLVTSAGEPPVDQDGRPQIRKLGTIDVDKVENSPIVFRGKLYRCEWYRNKGCFHFVEHETGPTTPEFAQGWCFANAFVAGDTVYVTGSQHGPKVQVFVSQDLEHWETYTAFDLPGHTIFNTSICKADDRYVMMYEIGEPAEEAGVPFTAIFDVHGPAAMDRHATGVQLCEGSLYGPALSAVPGRLLLQFLSGISAGPLRDARRAVQGLDPLAPQPTQSCPAGLG